MEGLMITLTAAQYRQLKRNAKLDGLLTDQENFIVIDDECKLICLHAKNVAVKKSLPKTKTGFKPLDFVADDTIGGIDYVYVIRIGYCLQFIQFIYDRLFGCGCCWCEYGDSHLD